MARLLQTALLLVVSGACLFMAATAQTGTSQTGREYHVSVHGDDANEGSQEKPLRTISAAAQLAQPGDIITVHSGVYRESVQPPRGGDSEDKRITYQSAAGEKAEIKGSEIIRNWEKVQGDTWKTVLPNSFFGDFNPYSDLIHGDWFNPKDRQHHTGAVYLNGFWLAEAAALEDVLQPASETPLWYGTVDDQNTTLWAQFKGVNPNDQEVEINVRKTVFYPARPNINYITVRGFTLCHAATQWAPPTAEQTGLIGTHWSRGWIIENNTVSHSIRSGISLGKYGDEWDNTSADTAEGYVKTIERALQNGWDKGTIGHHVVRNNTISHCEQAGIVGSLGAVFSTISGNTIHDIHVRQLFTGAEMSGIKLHAAVDVIIEGNRIYRCCRGLWLDWMAQGTRVSSNLFYDNIDQDLFVEVNHGPFVVDNNIFLSPMSLLSVSQGGAYLYNLMAGKLVLNRFDGRQTPFHKPHSTELAGMHDNPFGDDRYCNNILTGAADLSLYDDATLPVFMAGNVFLGSAKPSKHEKDPLVIPDYDPGLGLAEKGGEVFLSGRFDKAWSGTQKRQIITTGLLGRSAISGAAYDNADGTPLKIQHDYFGLQRQTDNPFPGPFETASDGDQKLKVWPVSRTR